MIVEKRRFRFILIKLILFGEGHMRGKSIK
jgi:hypothetical protein